MLSYSSTMAVNGVVSFLLVLCSSWIFTMAAPSESSQTFTKSYTAINSKGHFQGISVLSSNISLFDMLNNLTGDQNFSKIFYPFIDKAPILEPRHYYIQMDKPNLRSLFALKHPKVYVKVPGQRVDFNMMIKESPGTNPLYHFQKEEENIRMKVRFFFNCLGT